VLFRQQLQIQVEEYQAIDTFTTLFDKFLGEEVSP